MGKTLGNSGGRGLNRRCAKSGRERCALQARPYSSSLIGRYPPTIIIFVAEYKGGTYPAGLLPVEQGTIRIMALLFASYLEPIG